MMSCRKKDAADVGNDQGTEEVPPSGGTASEIARQQLLVTVLGMHRSGTSLCSHVLNALGISMAEDPVVVPYAPKGLWERLEIVAFHDRILSLLGRGYDCPALHDFPLPDGWWTDPRVTKIEHEITAFLEPRLAPGAPIGFKDPRTARLLRLWQEIALKLNIELKYILCLRHPTEVARSLNHRDLLPLDAGEYRWFVYMADILDALGDVDVCTIEYERRLDEPNVNATKLVRLLGLETELTAANLTGIVGSIVDRSLSHSDALTREPELPLVAGLYDAARRLDVDPVARIETARIIGQFRLLQRFHMPIQREFEGLLRMLPPLPTPAREGGTAPIATWREPAMVTKSSQLLTPRASDAPIMLKPASPVNEGSIAPH